MKKIMMLGAAVLAFQALPALAEEGPHGGKHGGPGRFFEKLDTDKDGSVTETEFLNSSKSKFGEMDSDKDGKITKAELEAHHAEKKKERDARRAEMKAKKEAGETVPADAARAE